MKKKINIKVTTGVAVCMLGLIFGVGCSDDFLKPDPLSFFEPSLTFTTKEGLISAIATCDRHLRHTYTGSGEDADAAPIITEMFLSDIAVNGTTDVNSPSSVTQDVIAQLVPDGLMNNNTNKTKWFWEEGYNGIKYANSIISNIGAVEGLDPVVGNEILGRAYFHRTIRYMHLLFQFGDIPLLTKEVKAPKFDYRSTKMSVILDKLTKDMEFAVENVPAKPEMGGMVTKGACRHLLIKCYLATGQFDKAIAQADELINNSGYALMTEPFGTFVNPAPDIHPVTRNVIWDLHRPENKASEANKEAIHYLVNREESASSRRMLKTMRNAAPFWAGTGGFAIKTPDLKADGMNVNQKHYDYRRTYGRGIARMRPTWYSTHSVWLNDETDLRHNVESGNWMVMEKLRYNSPALFTEGSEWAGKNIRLWNDEGQLLCVDTIRNWFDWPHYKIWIESPQEEGSTNYNGGAADWYFYRLAETYLLRAEAYMWKGEADKAAADVNKIRERAKCSKLFTATEMNMGVIMDERARELYYEEWRHMELSRVSYIFAITGKADEFGKTYTLQTLSDSNYWFELVTKNNNYYNKGVKTRSGIEYTIAPYHIFWPVPQTSINGNREGRINQNKGYAGYEHNIAPFDNLEDAMSAETDYKN